VAPPAGRPRVAADAVVKIAVQAEARLPAGLLYTTIFTNS
jgi:hypothetical protein